MRCSSHIATSCSACKEVVGELKARGHEAYKLHRTVARPWGAYTVLQEGPGFKIKRIEVKPGGSFRCSCITAAASTGWWSAAPRASPTASEVCTSRTNESTYIPVETRHRLENPGTEPW